MRPAKCFQSEKHSISPKGYIILCMENRCGQVCVSIFSFFTGFCWGSEGPWVPEPSCRERGRTDRQHLKLPRGARATEALEVGKDGYGPRKPLITFPVSSWKESTTFSGQMEFKIRPSPLFNNIPSCVSFTYPFLIVSHIHDHMHANAYKHKHTLHTSHEELRTEHMWTGSSL